LSPDATGQENSLDQKAESMGRLYEVVLNT
jgi:hypothetical protein